MNYEINIQIPNEDPKITFVATGPAGPTGATGATGAAGDFNSITTEKIVNDAVTFDKIQNVNSSRILGRKTAGDASIEQLTASDALEILGLSDTSSRANIAANTSGNATTITVTDNEGEGENNLITFVANGSQLTGSHGLEMDGDLSYNPGLGELRSPKFRATTNFIGDIVGNTDTDLRVESDKNITFVADLDEDDSSALYSFKYRSTQIASLDQGGSLQIDGSLDIHGDISMGGTGVEFTIDSGQQNSSNGSPAILKLSSFNTENNAIDINSSGGVDIDATKQIHLNSTQSGGVSAIRLNSAGGIDIDAGKIISVNTTDTTDGIKIGTEISGVPITIGHGTSEVNIGQNLTVGGSTTLGDSTADTVTVAGNLIVNGTTTTVNSTVVNLNDHNIVLDSGNTTSSVINNAGITIEGGTGDDAKLNYSTTSGGQWEFKLGDSFENLKVATLIGDVSATTISVDGTSGQIQQQGASTNNIKLSTASNGTPQQIFSTDTSLFVSASDLDPLVIIKNTNSNANSARLTFLKDKGAAGANGDRIGVINFEGDNSAQEETDFGNILVQINEATDTDEAGKMFLQVASSDGSTSNLRDGLTLTGHATSNIVDTTIGFGASSTVTIAGNLTVTSNLTLGGTAVSSIDTDLNSVSGNDDTLASAKAIKAYVDSQSGDITAVAAGSGLTGGGNSGDVTLNIGAGNLIDIQADQVDVDLTELTDMTESWTTGEDEFVVLDNGVQKRKLSSEIFGSNAFNSTPVDNVSIANLKTALAGGFSSNAVTIGDSGDTVTIGNDLIVTGNLTVSGATTTVNSTTVSIADPIFEIGDSSSDDNLDRGIKIKYNSSGAKIAFMGLDDSDGKFTMIPDATDNSSVFSGTAGTLKMTTFEGALSGNATTASSLATARNLSLTGDVTATLFSFDGGGNVTAAATIANEAVHANMLNNDIISSQTEISSALVSTDELIVSDFDSANDSMVIKKMDVSVLQTYMQNNLSFTTNSDVDVNVTNLTARLPQITESVQIGDADDVIVTTSGNLTVTGDLLVAGNNIKDSTLNTIASSDGSGNITIPKIIASSEIKGLASTGTDQTGGHLNLKGGTGTGSGTSGSIRFFGHDNSGSSGTGEGSMAQVASIDGSGNLQIDGDLTVSGNDIKDNDGTTCITFDSSGNTTIANTLNATLTGNVTGDVNGNASTATNLTASTSTAVGLGTIELGHASDTTISRAGAGDVNIENNIIYRAGGTDVPVTDGGTGRSTLAQGKVIIGAGTNGVTTRTIGIGNDNIVEIDDIDVANGDFAKFTGNGLEGRSVSEVLSDLGATTVGGNIFTLTNPGAVRFLRFNADNTVSALTASDFRSAIGAVIVGNGAGDALAGDTTTITPQQASDITANNAKTGITAQQASDITANNAKVSMSLGTASNQALAGDTDVVTKTGSETLTNKILTSPDINGGTIDAADITVGAGKTLDVSGGTLTLATDQISGDAISGGTIGTTTITALAGNLSMGDNNITNVGDIALDTISADDTSVGIGVSLADDLGTAFTIKQGSNAYLTVDTTNSSESVSIGTGISGTAINIGNTTSSETTIGDNLTVNGNLTVSGTTTTVNTATLTVEDPLIKLASGNTTSDTVDIGLFGVYDTSGSTDLYSGLFRDADDSGKWKLFKGSQTNPGTGTTINTSATGYEVATLVANIEGNVTGNVSGNTSGSSGSCTGNAATATKIASITNTDIVQLNTTTTQTGTKTFSGVIDITNTTDSTDATGDTGALRVEGGASIAKKLYVGTDLDVDGTANLDDVDIDGDTQIDGTLTVGVNDTGKDVKFFGATSGQYMLWDESEDELILAGDSKLSFHDGGGGENIVATQDGVLTINAGTKLDITAPTVDINTTTKVDIDSDAGIDLDGTVLSIDGTDNSNITVTGSAKDLEVSVTGGGTQELRLASAGTGASAIYLNASAGSVNIDSEDNVTIDAKDEISLTTTTADGHISLVSAHASGVAFHIDADTDPASEVQIDAGILDIDVTGAATLDAVGIAIDAGSGELDLTTTGTLDINANALAMDLTDSSEIKITSSQAAEDLTIEQAGNNDSSIIIKAAGTGSDAIKLNATAGGVDIDAAQGYDVDIQGGQVLVTSKANADNTGLADAIKLLTPSGAGGGAADTISIVNTQGTNEGALTLTATAGGVDVDAAALKNVNVSGGQVEISSKDNAAGAISLTANVGANETIKIVNTQGTTDGADDDGAIELSAAAGGIGLAWADSKDLWAEGGRAIITANKDAADAIKLHADAGASQTINIVNDEGTDAAAIALTASSGGIAINSAGNSNFTTSNADLTLSQTCNANDQDITISQVSNGNDTHIKIITNSTSNDAIKIDAVGGGIDIGGQLGDTKTLKLGNSNSTQITLSPSDTPADEKISLINVSGTANDAIKIDAQAGGITLDANGGTITFADGGSSLGTITSAGYSGTAATVTVTDDSGATARPVVFHDGNDGLLDDTGAFTYKPSTGEVTATKFIGAVTGNVSGTSGGIAITAASGTDTAGTNAVLKAGQSTGNKNGGKISFQTSKASASSSSDLNSLTEIASIDHDGVNGKIKYTLPGGSTSGETGGGDVVYFGNIESGGGALTPGDIYYLRYANNQSEWIKANADADAAAAASKNLLGVALGTAVSDGILLRGIVTLEGHVGDENNIGQPVFLSNTAGGVILTAATDTGDIIRAIGYVVNHGTNCEIYFNPSNTFIEV